MSSDPAEFDEERILQFIRPNRWISYSVGSYKLFAFNWVVSGVASLVLWLIVILFLALPEDMAEVFNVRGKPWVSQNFTWLYILTQDIWAIFLAWLCCSKYGNLKLGKPDDKPAFDDMTWFAMLFCCGLAVGFYFFGVGEPLYYYRQPTFWKADNYDCDCHMLNPASIAPTAATKRAPSHTPSHQPSAGPTSPPNPSRSMRRQRPQAGLRERRPAREPASRGTYEF